MRAKWKGNIDFVVDVNNIDDVRNPCAVISKSLLGQRVNIYTGKKGFSILIRDYMINERFGYYAICKKTGDFHPSHIKRKRGRIRGADRKARRLKRRKKNENSS